MDQSEKGVCRLSVVPVRKHPDDASEMVTQLLFGDHYTITNRSEDGKWTRIQIAFDNYDGWIDTKQHFRISNAYYDLLNHTEFKICTDLTSDILYKKQLIRIVIGSVLPISSSELFEMEEQLAFNGASKSMGERRNYDFLRQVAFKYRYAPYLWGGKTPFGTDCSGFTQQVYKICGYRLRRDASQQFAQGKTISKFEECLPGDLAFFTNSQGAIHHVGILIEDHKIIHASGYVRVDRFESKGIIHHSNHELTHKLAGIRRILQA
jgi:hypothetical protein